MLQRKFSEISVGETATLTRQITEEDVRRFVELTGDTNPLHVDRAFAERTPFKDVVVHGMLGANLISTMIGTQLPGEGALWLSQSFEFLFPVRLGDLLTLNLTVRSKHERERLLELDMKALNQNHQEVFVGQGRVKVLELQVQHTDSSLEQPGRAKAAIVTGATGGIGQAIARTLAKDGFGVVVCFKDRREIATSLVEEIRDGGGRAISLHLDLSNPVEIERLVQQSSQAFDGIDVLVNNASPRINPKAFEHLIWEDFSAHLNIQCQGAFWAVKACVPIMKAQGHGKIINITSQVTDGVPPVTWTAYSLAKAALANFSKSLAVELGPAGICVNCVAPGMTETALIGDVSEKARLMMARHTPLRRLAQPQDVAGAVSFLASRQSDYLSGETIRVNGGQFML